MPSRTFIFYTQNQWSEKFSLQSNLAAIHSGSCSFCPHFLHLLWSSIPCILSYIFTSKLTLLYSPKHDLNCDRRIAIVSFTFMIVNILTTMRVWMMNCNFCYFPLFFHFFLYWELSKVMCSLNLLLKAFLHTPALAHTHIKFMTLFQNNSLKNVNKNN